MNKLLKLANGLKRIRKDRGVTLKALSEASGYGESTINNFENGRTAASQEFLEKMANVLSVSVENILSEPQGHSSLREAVTVYQAGARTAAPDWAADLLARLEAFAPEQRQRVIRSLHLVMDGFLCGQAPIIRDLGDGGVALFGTAPVAAPRVNSDPRSSAGMEAAALTAAAMVGHNPPAMSPPSPRAASTSERRSAPVPPTPRESSRESKPPTRAPASRGNPN